MGMKWAQKQKGFTIVELLIVVVVIAILAAITIVSYNGITNRAHDSAVKSDLAILSRKLEIYKTENTYYPENTLLLNIKFKATIGSYETSPVKAPFNLTYCYKGQTSWTIDEYVVLAMSRSGNKYILKDGVISPYSGVWSLSSANITCADALPGVSANVNGYFHSDTLTGPWRAWAVSK